MLADARIGANVPVSNLDEAISFYEGKLGLALFEGGEEHHYARFSGAGETKLGVYVTLVRRDAGTRVAWLTASRRLRRKLEARYARLAGLVATRILEERRLPLAAL